MNNKLICGPMATISHPAFRILVEAFGACDEYFTEMINAGTLLTGGQFEAFYLNPAPLPEKLVWQLTGHDCDHMKEAARLLSQLPGIGIDINMGCSAPDIYKYGAGIAWMIKDRSETQAMVKAVRSVLPDSKRLSVKLRLGDDNFTDEGFFSFCDMLIGEGVELLTLHPRTKKEKLVRPPRYSYCQQLAERYKASGKEGSAIPVYLNGNVKDEASYKYALSCCPACAGVMISRAAVTRPWIFKLLKAAGQERPLEAFEVDMKQLAFDYIRDIQLYQPPEFWKTRLQRFFTYYSMNFTFSHYAQTQFLNAADIDDLISRIEDFFKKCPDEQILSIK